jgi:hypothetical protein
MSAPSWCQPCGGYRPRAHDCERRSTPAVVVDYAALNVPVPREATDPKFIAGWQAGYEAAMRDHAERRAA